LLEEKVVKILLDQADITEVSPDLPAQRKS